MKKIFLLLSVTFFLQGCLKYPQGSGGYDDKQGGNTQTPSGGRQQAPERTQYPEDRGSSTTKRNAQSSGRSANKDISVGEIRLTDKYTILYLSYTNSDKPYNYKDKNGQQQYSDGSQDIAWSNTSELISANGARTFKFAKAEGLPTISIGQDLKKYGYKLPSGKSVNFVVYFERLDKGLENFDLFECQSDGYICWNIYDL